MLKTWLTLSIKEVEEGKVEKILYEKGPLQMTKTFIFNLIVPFNE